MTEKKTKRSIRGETGPSSAAAVSPTLKANQANAGRVNTQGQMQGGADCRDALMRCYNR